MSVFIVDDSSFIILICRQALSKAGYEIAGEAFDGEEALEKIKETKPSIVLMDIALPKKNGFELAKEVMSELPETKIIAISALEDEWVEGKINEAGCVSFLRKPFKAMDLIEHIENAIGEGKELKYW